MRAYKMANVTAHPYHLRNSWRIHDDLDDITIGFVDESDSPPRKYVAFTRDGTRLSESERLCDAMTNLVRKHDWSK